VRDDLESRVPLRVVRAAEQARDVGGRYQEPDVAKPFGFLEIFGRGYDPAGAQSARCGVGTVVQLLNRKQDTFSRGGTRAHGSYS
jgi:hypothetical protein